MTQVGKSNAHRPFLGALSSVIILCGCATVDLYLDPYVTESPDAPDSVKRDLPKVTAAVATVDAWGKLAHAKRAEFTRSRRELDGVTFALGAGVIAAPLYKAHYDVMTALMLGAGTSYTANTLFNSSELSQVYGSASTAFMCVAGKGRMLQDAYSTAPSSEALNAQELELGGSLRACRTANSAAVDRYQNAIADLRAASSRVKQSDFAASNKLVGAGRNVVTVLNSEVDKRTPSSEAVLLAAKSVGSVGGVFAATETGPERAAGPGGTRQCTEADAKKLGSLSDAYEKRTQALDVALNALADLDSACTLSVASIANLSISQDAVVLAPGASVNIVIAGGRAPYTYFWQSESVANAVSASHFTPSVIAVRAGAAAKSGGPYTLVIRDSSATATLKSVSVMVSAGS